jgi:hypothetical protein
MLLLRVVPVVLSRACAPPTVEVTNRNASGELTVMVENALHAEARTTTHMIIVPIAIADAQNRRLISARRRKPPDNSVARPPSRLDGAIIGRQDLTLVHIQRFNYKKIVVPSDVEWFR